MMYQNTNINQHVKQEPARREQEAITDVLPSSVILMNFIQQSLFTSSAKQFISHEVPHYMTPSTHLTQLILYLHQVTNKTDRPTTLFYLDSQSLESQTQQLMFKDSAHTIFNPLNYTKD